MLYVLPAPTPKTSIASRLAQRTGIHPPKGEPDFATAAQLYVNPTECIDCDACIPVCPTTTIFNLEELPAELQEFVQKNALL